MTVNDTHRLLRSLVDRRVRFLVAGGLAVVAHGHVRFTADVDLLVDLSSENVTRFADALADCGYSPRAPVRVADLADPVALLSWVEDKNLVALSFWSSRAPMTEVDVLLDTPVTYEAAARNAVAFELAPGLAVGFVGLEDLLLMKRAAGRPKDLADIEALEALRQDGDDGC